MPPDPAATRARLAALTDAELAAEALRLILARKEALGDKDAYEAAEIDSEVCWHECLARGKSRIFTEATAAAEAEMRRRRELNERG